MRSAWLCRMLGSVLVFSSSACGGNLATDDLDAEPVFDGGYDRGADAGGREDDDQGVDGGPSKPPLQPSGVEQRCVELGSSCVCNEPLDTPDFVVTGSCGRPDKDNCHYDPDDEVPQELECQGELRNGSAWVQVGPLDPVPVSAANMPNGSTVSTVWRKDSTGVSHIVGPEPRSSSKRVCIRHYYSLSADYQAAVGQVCKSNKLVQFQFSEGLIISGQRASPDHYGWRATGFSFSGGASSNIKTQGRVTLDDCREQWCRAEFCVSGDLDTAENLYTDGYQTVVSGPNAGKTMTYTQTFLGNSAGEFRPTWITNMYRQGTCSGHRLYSHAMQAEWETDDGQFIGCAQEVEDTCR